MVTTYPRAQIEQALDPLEVIAAMEAAFVAYSRGDAVIPPVGELLFDDPPGDCHIKSGYIKSADTFAIKIATGFWENSLRGLPSSNGVVLVFSRHTGALLTILQDEGHLTDIRTAAAGAVAAKYLAPPDVECIGIVGAGIQAKLQLSYLRYVTDCRRVRLWARSADRARAFHVDEFDVEIVPTVRELAMKSRLIVTTTPSKEVLLWAADVQPGTHITAVGADGGGKHELDPQLFSIAAICAVDSRSQCVEFGDSSFAIERNLISPDHLLEVGEIIQRGRQPRGTSQDITVADLTGVAVQDIAIANLVLQAMEPAGGQ